LRGWGQGLQPVDATLLHVRGFDPATNRFTYEVNEQFGTARRSLIKLRQPVRMTMLVKIGLGPVREKQNLDRSLQAGRTRPGQKATAASLKQQGVSSLPNPLTSVLRQAQLLELTRVQEDSLARLSRRYAARLDSIWSVASERLATVPDAFELEPAWHYYLEARQSALDLMIVIGPLIRELLTGKQWRKLSMPLANAIDVRYLNAVRSGSDVYVGAPSIGGEQ
jgi:hypothetical protein